MQKNCRRVLVACLLSAGTAQAATLSGFVSDADSGEALTRATVALEKLQLRAVSNTSGYYAVVQVPAGTHIVSASHLGYQTRWDTLHFGAHEAVRLDLTLVPKPTDLGEQVSVEAERISLRVKPLQQLPALGEADLLRGLQLLPGIQAVADISSGLYVRGGGPDQTAILLDDITP
ncbi:MAG: carboxypeptidase regulatory-like domain-containing protein, partial [Gemmatimonadota bacterium]|nr:carboxypeptidase regulatory-like domain-containing protein [Gemmatimonadota bacterium]